MSRYAAGVCLVSALIVLLLIVRTADGVVSGEEPHSEPSVGVGAVGVASRNAPSSPLATSLASSYGPGLYGNVMACGGTLVPQTRAVAHRWLPCGTRLVICYDRTCTQARVRDRGPYVGGRTLDLSEAVVRALGYRSSQ